MKKFATTIEQSKRLMELGFTVDTADMVYHFTSSCIPSLQYELQCHRPTTRENATMNISKLGLLSRSGETGEQVFDRIWGKDIPAWSYLRLIDLIPVRIGKYWMEIEYNGHGFDASLYKEPVGKPEVTFESEDSYQNAIDLLAYIREHGITQE
jgi:hypothetical protein